MAAESLHGLKVALLATDGFEQAELTEPRKALDKPAFNREITRLFSQAARG
jgi:protease I